MATNSLNTNGLFILYTTIWADGDGFAPVVVMIDCGALLGFTTAYLIQRLPGGPAFVWSPFPSVIMAVSTVPAPAVLQLADAHQALRKGRQPRPSWALLLQFGALLVMFALAMLEAVSSLAV